MFLLEACTLYVKVAILVAAKTITFTITGFCNRSCDTTGYFCRTQVGSGIQQKYPVTGYSTERKGISVAKLARDVAKTFSSATF